MNTPDSIMTTAPANPDKSHDTSDVLSLLQVLEQLFAACRMVVTRQAATAVLLSMAIETEMLLAKLQAMRSRWSVHLPFKEACTVDFVCWSNRMAQLAAAVREGHIRHCLAAVPAYLSSHCLADLYSQSADGATAASSPSDDASPRSMLSRWAALQAQLSSQREQCIESISQMVAGRLAGKEGVDASQLSDLAIVRKSCATLLDDLSAELNALHEQQVKIFSPEDYERLADRILEEAEYEGPTARREARDIMHNWRNGVPTGRLEESRSEQIEQTKEEIRRTKHGVKFEQYVSLDGDFFSQRSEFGRFLFNRRREITHAELRQLLRLVYCVYYYQEDARQEARRQTVLSGGSVEASEGIVTSLPVEFCQPLRDSQAATALFLETLRRVEPYINNNGSDIPGCTPELVARYKAWKWCYLQTAFEQLGFLQNNAPKAPFARFINRLFPLRKTDSVERDLYRNTNVNSRSIVADVVKEFQPVRSLMTQPASR